MRAREYTLYKTPLKETTFLEVEKVKAFLYRAAATTNMRKQPEIV